MVEIDEIAAMAANNSVAIERFFQPRQCLPHQILTFIGVHGDVVARGLEDLDLLRPDHTLPCAGLHDEAAALRRLFRGHGSRADIAIHCDDRNDPEVDLDIFLVLDQQVVQPVVGKDE